MAMYRQTNFAGPNQSQTGGGQFTELTGSMRDLDTQDQIAASKYNTELGIQPALQAEANKMSRFNTLMPFITGQLRSIKGQMATAGGQSGKSPEITVGGVWNPQQVQQQVNSMRSGNDMAAQSQMAQQGRELAGRGFGGNSPLLAALRGQTQANTLAQNVGGERDIRLGAADKNAGQLLKTQQARESQHASRMDEDIRRRQPYFQMASTLLNSLAGLV